MLIPTPVSVQPTTESCGKCGAVLTVATVTTILDLDGIDYREWDDTEYTKPIRQSREYKSTIDCPDHKERKFFEWSRSHGLNDDTVFTLLANNIKRIATLRNTPAEFLDEMDLTKGQKLILKSLMEEDWSCSFCGTYHDSPKNNCSVRCRKYPHTSYSVDYTLSLKKKTAPSDSATSSTSLPDEYDTAYDDETDPLYIALSRGRRNTTGQNFGYLNCHPKYWADILPVPTKLIKLL